jgi:hypothetical protein
MLKKDFVKKRSMTPVSVRSEAWPGHLLHLDETSEVIMDVDIACLSRDVPQPTYFQLL